MTHALPTDTHAERVHAIETLPWLLKQATVHENPFYGVMYADTMISLAAWAWPPWRWNS